MIFPDETGRYPKHPSTLFSYHGWGSGWGENDPAHLRWIRSLADDMIGNWSVQDETYVYVCEALHIAWVWSQKANSADYQDLQRGITSPDDIAWKYSFPIYLMSIHPADVPFCPIQTLCIAPEGYVVPFGGSVPDHLIVGRRELTPASSYHGRFIDGVLTG